MLDDERQKLWIISQIYGWTIVLIGFAIFLWLIFMAGLMVYELGFSFESLFALIQIAEGIGIGGGFVAFGTALRGFVIVQATLCVILLLITVWFVVFFLMYSEWNYCLASFGIGFGVTLPLALSVFVNRKHFNGVSL